MKAVLVIDDMPKRCAVCPLRNNMAGKKLMCYATMQDLSDEEYCKEKPDWCPLKENYEQEIRNKAIEEFVVEAMKQLTELELTDDYPTVTDCKSILFEVVKSMKGEKE